jgi:hypothetical protein
MATRNTYQDDSISAHTDSADALGLQELLDQATQVLTDGDVSQARHLVQMAALLYDEPRLTPILDGLLLREVQVRNEECLARCESGVIGTTKDAPAPMAPVTSNLWYMGFSCSRENDSVRWLFSGRAF